MYRNTSGELIFVKKKRDFNVRIVHLHSRDVCFQSLPGQHVSWQIFHGLLGYFEANSGLGPQLNKGRFNSNALQTSFINQPTIFSFLCYGAIALVSQSLLIVEG